MKRVLILLLVFVMCFVFFVGCGGPATDEGNTSEQSGDVEYPVMKLTMAAQGKDTADINITSKFFMDLVTEYSGGNITFDEYWNAQLGTGPDQLTNIGNGVADIGDIVTLYTPADLPLSQIACAVPFISTDPAFVAELQNKFAEAHPEVVSEWEAAGCHLFFYKGIGGYNVVGNLKYDGEVKVEDMKNMKIMMGGVYYPLFFQAINAAPYAAASSSAAYTDIKQNVADTSFLNTIGIKDQSLYEVSDVLVKTGLGGRAIHAFVINNDVWNSLDDNTKALFDKCAAEALEKYNAWAIETETEAEGIITDNGTEITEVSAEEQGKWGEAILSSKFNTIQKWIDSANEAGFDGEQYMSDYLSLAQELGFEFPYDVSAYIK